jgi:hypothetical protein
MDNWQFLIQKQGDHTWRTLESPNLKILSDNYRVLARSDLNNTGVDVRVTHIKTDEMPPKRRFLKRSRRTNADGLMAVIPFTHFKPGIWELRCSSDVMSEMLGKSWQHTLFIQVSPQETSQITPIEVVEESDIDIASEADTEVNIVMNHVAPVWFKGETTEQILQNLLDLALPKDDLLLDEETIENAPTLPPSLPLHLSLDQDAYVARWGDNFTIHGDVEINDIENLENDRFSTDNLSQLRLEITLRSPLESKILSQIQQPLTNHSLPFSFSTVIDIPHRCESKLLLANINLYGTFADLGEVVLLANHTFTITADVTELLALQTSKLDYQESFTETNPEVKSKPSISIGLELFNVAKTAKLAQFQILKPSSNKTLPPKIKPRLSWVISPQLPHLPDHPTSETTNDQGQDSLKKILIIPPIDLKKLAIKSVKTTFPYLKRLKVESANGETVNDQLVDEELVTLNKSPQLPNIVTLSVKIPESPPDNLSQTPTDEPIMDDTDDTSYAELIAEIVGGFVKSEELDVVDTQDNSLILNDEELNVVDTQDNSLILNNEELDVVETQDNSLILNDEELDVVETQDNYLILNDEELNVVDTQDNYLILNDEELNVVDTQDNYLILNDEELDVVDTQANSPLLQQWMESQGYLLTEAISEQSSDNNFGEETQAVEGELLLTEEMELQEDSIAQNIHLELNEPEVVTFTSPTPPEPVWLSQEIVMDDLVIELDSDNLSGEVIEDDHDSPLSEDETAPDFSPVIMESLATPELYLPGGELIAGTSVTVRVELAQFSSSVRVKLWVEDYQTRSLLDGPHILPDLRGNARGRGETSISLQVPFGCLEIRLAAIALNQATQQESNKFTIIKTVIPPDLPRIEPDEMLGI